MAVMCGCLDKAGSVTSGKLFHLALFASMPNRSDGVNDEACWEAEAGCNFGFPYLAPPKEPANLDKSGAGCAMDGSIHSASA
jgi:hypothetical protein